MTETSKTANREAAQQVFRQFAWNLAGTLVKTGKVSTGTRKSPRRRSGGRTPRK